MVEGGDAATVSVCSTDVDVRRLRSPMARRMWTSIVKLGEKFNGATDVDVHRTLAEKFGCATDLQVRRTSMSEIYLLERVKLPR